MGMGLGASSRRNQRKKAGFSEINVTPLVDVMLVLLVIFMITAPMLTVGVPVDLPKTKAAKMNDQVEPLIVTIDAEGKSYLQEMELTGEALIARLLAVTGSNPDAKIYVRGDQKLSYGRIMEVMGEIASAGFNRVSLIAEMPAGPIKKQQATLFPQQQMIGASSPPNPAIKPTTATSEVFPVKQQGQGAVTQQLATSKQR